MRAPYEDTLVAHAHDIAGAEAPVRGPAWRDRLKRFGILCAIWAMLPGHVTVQVRRDGDTLSLQVLDNGVGLLRNGSRVGHGIGVDNTRARLSAIYGSGATLTLRQAPAGACVAEVRLPLEPVTVG
jgi:hypothetical protein